MNAIEAMQAEIGYQVHDLQKQDLPLQSRNCLLVGSGDSYVAGLAAQYFSGGRALCCYPTDLIQNPSVADGRNVYVVSISGSTKANILAAKIAKKQGARTTAITAKPASALARGCDQVIELKYRSVGVTTAGTISFTSSMLACISLAEKIQLPDLGRVYRQAQSQADRIVRKIDKNRYFMLGDGILYPVAIYGALKLNEVFGARTVAYPTEEFCHSPLFSIKKSDQVIALNAEQLSTRLNRDGFSSINVDFKGGGIELLLRSAFFMQLLILKLAQRRALAGCYFLKNKKLLRTSSDFIY
ncbi:MAG TPA: SIS domain-containing protein [Nitrososphaera sp.]|nr:SIS domain-containing protein [Nitrososphaera sp.]